MGKISTAESYFLQSEFLSFSNQQHQTLKGDRLTAVMRDQKHGGICTGSLTLW